MLDPRFENVSGEENAAIICIERLCSNLADDHDWHFHPQFELTYFARSSGTRYVGDSVLRYGPGDLVLSGPNLPHCWRNDVDDDENPAEWISVQFSPSCFGQDFLALAEASHLTQLLEESQWGLSFPQEGSQKAALLMRELCHAQGLTRILRLAEILDMLARTPRERLATRDYHRNNVVDKMLVQRLGRVTAYIADHFRGSISQADLAHELGMTPTAFSKFVRASTGQTFMGMVKIARVNEACRLLANTTERITDIALECGYQHTSHFDRHFIELKGIRPSDYRERMRELSVGAS